MNIHITGLHRLPFDAQRFAADYAAVADHDDGSLRKQWLENWHNAWLLVFETDAPPDQLDFGEFWYGSQPGPDAQAAWQEQILSHAPGRTIGAFFLHYVTPQMSLGYGTQRLPLPEPTPAPSWLWDRIPYTSPD